MVGSRCRKELEVLDGLEPMHAAVHFGKVKPEPYEDCTNPREGPVIRKQRNMLILHGTLNLQLENPIFI